MSFPVDLWGWCGEVGCGECEGEGEMGWSYLVSLGFSGYLRLVVNGS